METIDWNKTEELKIVHALLHTLEGRDQTASLNAILAVLATKAVMVSSVTTIKDNLDAMVASLRDRVDVCMEEKARINKERTK